MAPFNFSRVDLVFTVGGLLLMLLDIGSDIFAVVAFYQEGDYISLALLLLFLLGSSVLVHLFSWFWYSYEGFRRETKTEKCLSLWLLHLLHVLQLAIYFRCASVLEVTVFRSTVDEGVAVFLSHDLTMLRLVEAFAESSPQLVLVLTIILQRGQLDPETVWKAVSSALAIAASVTFYHRSLRSFLPEKEKQKVLSSVVYYSWNLILISSRILALALFSSALPCFIFAHFFSSWMILFFLAWRVNTKFMDSSAGEWLYRGTVGLIWYFAWFNVEEGKSRGRSLIYHCYQLLDICLLCGLCGWKMNTEPSQFGIAFTDMAIVSGAVVAAYLIGLSLKLIYYTHFHPNLSRERLKGEPSPTGDEVLVDKATPSDMVDSVLIQCDSHFLPTVVDYRSGPESPSPTPTSVPRCNKRMRQMAVNFYS